MSSVLTLSPSGLPAVDRQWGGFDAGATYLLVGTGGAGRSALQAARATVDGGGACLLLSPRSPDELAETGRGVGFDLAAAHGSGLLHPLRIPTAAALAERGSDDLEAAYRGLIGLVRSQSPARVVVEDATPLVQFDSAERLEEAFAGLAASLRALGSTLVVGLGAPADGASDEALDVVRRVADGVVRVGEDGELTLDPAPNAAPPDDERVGTPFLSEVVFDAPADGARSGGAVSPQGAGAKAAPAPPAAVIAPPAVDPALLHAGDGLPGVDPADALLEQGYLADSSGDGQSSPPAPAPPAVAPAPPEPAPESPDAAFRSALADAFQARSADAPFLVVAVRMEPAAPEAAHFADVAAAVGRSLPNAAHLLTDDDRKRLIVLLPAAGAEAGQALFEALRADLRQSVGAPAEATLRAISAVTIPDAQPFETPADLMAYAFDS
ncbi:ATPase domain-containing protein [Rubrivirga sp. S365]|uniref:ATPase domain-containing protein n=1 Tax=Rubrivirga litoralis TaxID=3075598 RepID=A0ABU3BNU4_9BACT|nr:MULTISPECIES: ATPase domain-containing protein [unclassified Rubrivirga]MDT0630957.1 ATPase domain-containing protein [Rubrivirga sp. F394]MDT7856600.1 ATPase domain-containing protein [Rubrivirga sp. S365]